MYLLGRWLLSLIGILEVPLLIAFAMGSPATIAARILLDPYIEDLHPRTEMVFDVFLWTIFGLAFLLIGMWALPELHMFLKGY